MWCIRTRAFSDVRILLKGERMFISRWAFFLIVDYHLLKLLQNLQAVQSFWVLEQFKLFEKFHVTQISKYLLEKTRLEFYLSFSISSTCAPPIYLILYLENYLYFLGH